MRKYQIPISFLGSKGRCTKRNPVATVSSSFFRSKEKEKIAHNLLSRGLNSPAPQQHDLVILYESIVCEHFTNKPGTALNAICVY